MKKLNKLLILIFLLCFVLALCCCTKKDLTYSEIKELGQKNGYNVIEYSSESDISKLETEIYYEYQNNPVIKETPYLKDFGEVNEIKIEKALLILKSETEEVFYAFWTENYASASICYTVLREKLEEYQYFDNYIFNPSEFWESRFYIGRGDVCKLYIDYLETSNLG